MTWLYITFAVVFLLWLGKQMWCSGFGVPSFWCEMYDVDFNFSSDEPDKGTSSGE